MIYLAVLAVASGLITALGYWMRREQKAQDLYQLEQINRKAAERETQAAQNAPRTRADITQRLRDGTG